MLPYAVIENSAADISVLFAQVVSATPLHSWYFELTGGQVFGGGTATKVAITLSAVTNVIVSTYTAAKGTITCGPVLRYS